jgi:hypothetical protein
MDYIQIDRTNCMEIMLQEFPAFRTQWDLHVESWNPLIDRPIALDVAEFADFAIDTICLGVDLEIDRLVAMTELMLLKGDSTIEYIFRKMFLEQIAHRSVKGRFSVDLFIRKLQPLASYHWQAMDRQWSIHPSGISID